MTGRLQFCNLEGANLRAFLNSGGLPASIVVAGGDDLSVSDGSGFGGAGGHALIRIQENVLMPFRSKNDIEHFNLVGDRLHHDSFVVIEACVRYNAHPLYRQIFLTRCDDEISVHIPA